MTYALYRVEFQMVPGIRTQRRLDVLLPELHRRGGNWTVNGSHYSQDDYRPVDVRLEVAPEHEAWLRLEVQALVLSKLVLESGPAAQTWEAPPPPWRR